MVLRLISALKQTVTFGLRCIVIIAFKSKSWRATKWSTQVCVEKYWHFQELLAAIMDAVSFGRGKMIWARMSWKIIESMYNHSEASCGKSANGTPGFAMIKATRSSSLTNSIWFSLQNYLVGSKEGGSQRNINQETHSSVARWLACTGGLD